MLRAADQLVTWMILADLGLDGSARLSCGARLHGGAGCPWGEEILDAGDVAAFLAVAVDHARCHPAQGGMRRLVVAQPAWGLAA